MAVPYTFGTATSSIPLSQLDSNFNTVITLGNTAIQLGNTVTTLNNMTLANVTISSGNVTITNVAITTANVTTANITTAVIGTETVTMSTITTANVTTANITTNNITNGTVITSLTLSYGTANGVAYLNGSKVLTTGSALTFDGTTLLAAGGVSTAIGSGGNYLLRYTTANINSRTWRLANDINAFGDFAIQQSTTQAGSTFRDVYTSLNDGTSYWSVAGSEQMRLTSTGLGIGTSSPNLKLDVNSGSTASTAQLKTTAATAYSGGSFFAGANLTIRTGANATGNGSGIRFASDNNGALEGMFGWVQNASSYGDFVWQGYNGSYSERMRLDSSGNLLLGRQTSDGYRLNILGTTQILSGHQFTFSGIAAASLTVTSDGAMAFGLDGATGSTERARIDSSGNLLVGTTSATTLGVGTAPIQSNGTMFSGGSNAGFAFKDRSAATFSLWYKSGGTNYFYTSGAGANVATINETTGIYTPLSDVNKKKDFEPSFVGLDVVMQLQPKLFRMLSDDGAVPKQLGFIAQDVQSILPQAYVEQKNGDSTFIGLQDRPFIAALVKAIQEQQALITSLTARITALEST